MAGTAPPGELTASTAERTTLRSAERSVRRAAVDGWTIDWARPDDDAAIRSLLRRSVIPGAVRVAFTREPSDASGAGLAGSTDLTIVARSADRVAGLGRCSIRVLHRNGVPVRIGYLSALRLLPGAPASPRLLRDGYVALADAAMRAGVDGFVTTIADDNARARRVLEHGGRFGLPTYRELASLVTLVAPASGRGASRRSASQPAEMEGGAETSADVGELTDFLQMHAPRAHLTLTWDAARWHALARHGVTPASFVVVRRNTRIVAAAALWDQRPFRQTIIDGYEGALQAWRPLVNAVQSLRALPRLPAPGTSLAQGAVLGATVAESREWPELWRRLHDRARALRLDWLVLTRDARAEELPLLRQLTRARTYETTLYDVAWRGGETVRDGAPWCDGWDARLYAPEAGLL